LGSGYQRLDLDLDPRVYLAGLALTVASALLIGMVPARQAGGQSAADDQERTGRPGAPALSFATCCSSRRLPSARS
jgi:hypothetical protein